MRKFVITSATQLAQTLQNNPALYDIPIFLGIKKSVDAIAANSAKSCNCSAGSKPNIQSIPELHTQMETILRNLSESDLNRMKTLLKLDQICYYKRDTTGRLAITCL